MYRGSVPWPRTPITLGRVKVSAPDGRTWKVGRRWMPRRPRLGRADVSDAMPDFLNFDGGPGGRKIADVAEQLRSGAQIDAPRQHR